MTSKTTRYSESITTLLAERYHIQPEAAQGYPPQQVFALIVEAHLGKRWTREIPNWIEAVGGRIEWETEADGEQYEPYCTHCANTGEEHLNMVGCGWTGRPCPHCQGAGADEIPFDHYTTQINYDYILND